MAHIEGCGVLPGTGIQTDRDELQGWLSGPATRRIPASTNYTEWLIEYNFNRPHQSLGYLAPVEYTEKELAKIRSPVLPMWSASTRY